MKCKEVTVTFINKRDSHVCDIIHYGPRFFMHTVPPDCVEIYLKKVTDMAVVSRKQIQKLTTLRLKRISEAEML